MGEGLAAGAGGIDAKAPRGAVATGRHHRCDRTAIRDIFAANDSTSAEIDLNELALPPTVFDMHGEEFDSSTTSRTGNEEAEANTDEDGVVGYCDPEKTNFEFDEGIGECPLRFEPADADDDGEIDGCSPRTTSTLPPTTTTGDPATTTTTTTTSSPTTTTTQPPP